MRISDWSSDVCSSDLIAVVAQRAAAAWHAWHAGGLHRADRLDIVAHQADGLGLGPDEDEAGLLDATGEVRVLAEEAVARMARLRGGDLGRRDDRCHVDIPLVPPRKAYTPPPVVPRPLIIASVHRGIHPYPAYYPK